MRHAWALALTLGSMVAAACATGVTDESGFEGSSNVGVGGAGGVDNPETVSSSSSSSAGVGGAGGTGGSEPACDYTATNTCQTAQQLQALAGDENGPTLTEVGQTSKWFAVHIEEADGGILDNDLSYTVTLVSPPGMDFDLYVYPGPQDGNPDCNATPLAGNHASPTETVHDSWDDDQPLGGEDDSVWLSIEVRYVSGMECGPDAEWTLTIKGNT